MTNLVEQVEGLTAQYRQRKFGHVWDLCDPMTSELPSWVCYGYRGRIAFEYSKFALAIAYLLPTAVEMSSPQGQLEVEQLGDSLPWPDPAWTRALAFSSMTYIKLDIPDPELPAWSWIKSANDDLARWIKLKKLTIESEIRGPLAFNENDRPEIWIEQMRAARRMVYATWIGSERKFEVLDIAQELFSSIERLTKKRPLDKTYAQLMGLLPFGTTFTYQQASFRLQIEDVERARVTLSNLVGFPETRGMPAGQSGIEEACKYHLGALVELVQACKESGDEHADEAYVVATKRIAEQSFVPDKDLVAGEAVKSHLKPDDAPSKRFLHPQLATVLWTEKPLTLTQARADAPKWDHLLELLGNSDSDDSGRHQSVYLPNRLLGQCCDMSLASTVCGKHGDFLNPVRQTFQVPLVHVSDGHGTKAIEAAQRIVDDWTQGALPINLQDLLDCDTYSQKLVEQTFEPLLAPLPKWANLPRPSQTRALRLLVTVADTFDSLGSHRIAAAILDYCATFLYSADRRSEEAGPAKNQHLPTLKIGGRQKDLLALSRTMGIRNRLGLIYEVTSYVQGHQPNQGPLDNEPINLDLYPGVVWEYGTALMRQGHLEQADKTFNILLSPSTERGDNSDLNVNQVPRVPTPPVPETVSAMGTCGIIDVMRRRPSPNQNEIQSYGDRQKDGFTRLQSRVQVDIAVAWSALHNRQPADAIATMLDCLETTPKQISAWIGVCRGLRMLGKGPIALQLILWLLGERDDRPVVFNRTIGDTNYEIGELKPDVAVCREGLALRHHATLAAERGWCLLDLDRTAEAAAVFDRLCRTDPYLFSVLRGRMRTSERADPTYLEDLKQECLANLQTYLWTDLSTGHITIERASLELEMEQVRALVQARLVDAGLNLYRERIQGSLPYTQQDTRTWPSGDKIRYILRIIDALLDQNYLTEVDDLLADLARIDPDHWSKNLFAKTGQSSPDPIAVLYRIRVLLARQDYLSLGRLLTKVSAIDSLSDHYLVRIATKISHFEMRNYQQARETRSNPGIDADDPNKADKVSDIDEALWCWATLALAEQPEIAVVCRPRLLNEVGKKIASLQPGTVSTIHLRAMYLATVGKSSIGHIQPRSMTQWAQAMTEAVDLLNRACKLRPNDGSLKRDKAAVLADLDRLTEAAQELDLAVELAPDDARIYLLQGALAHRTGDHHRAVGLFRTAANLDPRDFVHHRALIMGLMQTGQYDKALEWLRLARREIHVSAEATRHLHFRLLLLEKRIEQHRIFTLPRNRQRKALIDLVADVEGLSPPDQIYLFRGPDPEDSTEPKIRKLLFLAELNAQLGKVKRAQQALDQAQIGLEKIRNQLDHEATEMNLPFQDFRPELVEELQRADTAIQMVKSKASPLLRSRVVDTDSQTLLYVVWFTALACVSFAVMFLFELPEPAKLMFVAASITSAFLAIFVSMNRSGGSRLRVGVIQVDLHPTDPVPELVHVDLDFSAGKPLMVSGLSFYRPEVPSFTGEFGEALYPDNPLVE